MEGGATPVCVNYAKIRRWEAHNPFHPLRWHIPQLELIGEWWVITCRTFLLLLWASEFEFEACIIILNRTAFLSKVRTQSAWDYDSPGAATANDGNGNTTVGTASTDGRLWFQDRIVLQTHAIKPILKGETIYDTYSAGDALISRYA